MKLFGKTCDSVTIQDKIQMGVALSDSCFSSSLRIKDIIPVLAEMYPEFDKKDTRLNFYDTFREPKFSKIQELLKVMDEIAEEHDCPVGHVALNWSTQKEFVGTALVGVRSVEHAKENCSAFTWELTQEEMTRLDRKLEELEL